MSIQVFPGVSHCNCENYMRSIVCFCAVAGYLCKNRTGQLMKVGMLLQWEINVQVWRRAVGNVIRIWTLYLCVRACVCFCSGTLPGSQVSSCSRNEDLDGSPVNFLPQIDYPWCTLSSKGTYWQMKQERGDKCLISKGTDLHQIHDLAIKLGPRTVCIIFVFAKTWAWWKVCCFFFLF